MTTEKALREALDEIALRFVSGNKIQIDSARISRSEWLLLQAALSLPETQGEPVGENLEPLPPEVHEAINAYAAYYAEHHKLGMSIRKDMQYIASVALRFAAPAAPTQAKPTNGEGA